MASSFSPQQLGQTRPANTTAVSIHSPAANTITHVTRIMVCNVSGAAATYRIFLDYDGTTYDQTTALYYDINLAANSTVEYEFNKPIPMANSAGNLAVRTGTANAINFTAYGIVENI